MRLKSFYASTMTEAMQMVRDALGEDAVIVASREENGGKSVHVTAAIDPSSYDGSFEIGHDIEADDTEAAPADDWLQYDEEQELSAVEEEITDVMLRHGVPEDVMDHILSCATVIGLDNPGVAMVAAIEHLFSFKPLSVKPTKKPFMMIGTPGSGKTLACAKLATRGVMNDLNIGVITTDTVRAGGVEQLEAFTKLLGIDLIQCSDPGDFAHMLADMGGYDQIVIDTPGINPFDTDDIRAMAKLIGSADLEALLVLAAGGDAEESAEISRSCATIGASGLISTRIDIARRFGGILAGSYTGGLPFADISDTPKVADGLKSIDPARLSRLLMPSAYPAASQSSSRPTSRQKQRVTS